MPTQFIMKSSYIRRWKKKVWLLPGREKENPVTSVEKKEIRLHPGREKRDPVTIGEIHVEDIHLLRESQKKPHLCSHLHNF